MTRYKVGITYITLQLVDDILMIGSIIKYHGTADLNMCVFVHACVHGECKRALYVCAHVHECKLVSYSARGLRL